MEQKTYVFRCIRFIGEKAAPVLSHKLSIFIIAGFAVLLYLPSLFNGFHTDDYTHLLTFRPDNTSLIVEPEGGYNPLPSGHINPETGKTENFHISIVNEWTDTFFYNPHSPWKPGDIIDITGVSIKVMDVTRDGRILRASFHFEKPLEADAYKWIIWDPEKAVYTPFVLPGIGEEVSL